VDQRKYGSGTLHRPALGMRLGPAQHPDSARPGGRPSRRLRGRVIAEFVLPLPLAESDAAPVHRVWQLMLADPTHPTTLSGVGKQRSQVRWKAVADRPGAEGGGGGGKLEAVWGSRGMT
jgi:hypothetical protein